MTSSKSPVSTMPEPSRSLLLFELPQLPTIARISFTFTTPSPSRSSGQSESQMLLSEQNVCIPCQAPPTAVQSSLVRSRHHPEPQHAPMGCGHEVVEQLVLSPIKAPPTARQSSSETGPMQVPSIKQHAPSGKHVVEAQLVPSPIWVPPTTSQVVWSNSTQAPVDGTQHAPLPEPQEYDAQVVPALCDVPPNTAHSCGDKSVQELSLKQQAAGSLLQLTGVYEERITQSPLGVQSEGKS